MKVYFVPFGQGRVGRMIAHFGHEIERQGGKVNRCGGRELDKETLDTTCRDGPVSIYDTTRCWDW